MRGHNGLDSPVRWGPSETNRPNLRVRERRLDGSQDILPALARELVNNHRIVRSVGRVREFGDERGEQRREILCDPGGGQPLEDMADRAVENAQTESLAIAWLIGCLGPSVPVPAPFLTGPQGAGKSTGTRMLRRIIEGMSSDLRRAPKGEENLIAAVAAGWVTALDNLSHLGPDLSDLMCCIVTGAETIKRALFTDGDVVRSRYRKPLLLTGVDVSVIRPDLAERLLPLRLERPLIRRTEAELWAEFEEILPLILGSLLDLTVKVRAAQAQIPTDLRMADFAHLCAQLDTATGFGALDAYRASLDDLNDDVIEGDVLAQTVLGYAAGIEPGADVRMTSSEWLHALTQLYTREGLRVVPKGCPTTGKVLSDRLKRLQPVLAARGVVVDWGRTKAARYIEMTRPPLPSPDERSGMF